MRLDNLCDSFDALCFPTVEEKAHPELQSVLGVRSKIGEALGDDEFLVDCIAHELRLLESARLRQGLVPFLTLPGLGVRFAFGYWAPGISPEPHEHTAWTITAVCRNRLDVLTYDRAESYRRRELAPKNRFEAPAGKVGFIYEPCIHAPMNPTGDWSLSLHVISPRDGEPLVDCVPFPELRGFPRLSPAEAGHPYLRALGARQRQQFVHLLARILIATVVPQASLLLAECFRLGSSATRRMIERYAPTLVAQLDASDSPHLLTRTDDDLVFAVRSEGDSVALHVETPRGSVKALVVNDVAHEAITFAAEQPSFDVRALPGSFSEEERTAIADALEGTGFFRRVHP